MTSTERITVVIVSYGTAAMTCRAIDGVLSRCSGVDRVVVVDNASPDDSVTLLRERFGGSIDLIALEENIGFARAVNMAVEEVAEGYLLLLNPDVVVQDDVTAALLDFARRRPMAGVWGGRTLRADGSTDPSSCWGLPTLRSTMCFGLGLTAAFPRNRVLDPESMGPWDRDAEREVGLVTGCLLLVHSTTWKRVGGFDERFFMYGEDADLAFRLRAVGLRPAITPTATIVHFVGASSSGVGKRMMVLRAKATLIRLHVRAPRLALRMLLLGVAVRSGVHGSARLLGRESDDTWRVLLRERRSWLAGYPEVTAAAARPQRV